MEEIDEIYEFLGVTEEELNSQIKEAIETGKYENCFSMPELMCLPLVESKRAEHVNNCPYCGPLYKAIVAWEKLI